ncbi:MAG: glutamine-hydrolyzing GMP synthase [Anaerolineae bacterium]
MQLQTAGRNPIIILDFGSQYSQLIARRVREQHVYSLLIPYTASAEEVMALQPAGFILSGGPASVYEEEAPQLPSYVLASKLPVLGICYGMQLLAKEQGGRVQRAEKREYGPSEVMLTRRSLLFASLPDRLKAWMSHGDQVEELPSGFQALATTSTCPIAAMGSDELRIYGLQFHPEVAHTPQGSEIIADFLFRICKCQPNWTVAFIIEQAVAEIRARVGCEKVVCALSGGVDSSVAAAIIHRAIGDQLTCIFVDTGLMREGEPEQVIDTFGHRFGAHLIALDESKTFFSALTGVTDPEQKRSIIGERFIRVFEREARALGNVRFLGQGTLYPDVIESRGPERAVAARIKTHHNVGGLPADMNLELVEPLRYLFKDEVRQVGAELGLPEEIVWRHPFPGPGLAVRVIGEVTPERVAILRRADAIFIEEIRKAGLYRAMAQAFAVALPECSVGVMGDSRTYSSVIALRAVTSQDFMTADWARLPYELLATASSRIANEVPAVNRVVYDISTKPPATIEWE